MRISIVEKNEVKFYGIENHASESSDFTSFWKNYYKYVAADYNEPVGYILHALVMFLKTLIGLKK